MGSWQFALFYPPAQEKLRPAKSISHLTKLASGLKFDEKIRMCIQIDEAGHLLDCGAEISLNNPVIEDLVRYLQQGKSFSVGFGSFEIYGSFAFFLEPKDPSISIGWHRRQFGQMSEFSKKVFWNAIRYFARDANSGYVIIIDDVPDNFEDRFIKIGDERILDTRTNHEYGLGLREIWLQSHAKVRLPEGPKYGSPNNIGDGFCSYPILCDS